MYILIDIEATCWITAPRPLCQFPETIEIAAIKTDKDLNFISEFHSFIKPQINPILSISCMELTGIQQKDVDEAPSFQDTMIDFYNWLPKEKHKILSWGLFDKSQLIRELKNKDCPKHIGLYLKNSFVDLNSYFKKKYKLAKTALLLVGEQLEIEMRPAHRAYNDVYNMYDIAKIKSEDILRDLKYDS